MNTYQNDIKWFLNVYGNNLKEHGQDIAVKELKKAIYSEYSPVRNQEKKNFLYSAFFGETYLIDIKDFYLYIINWYEHYKNRFTNKDKYKFELGADGDNPREICTYANSDDVGKPKINKYYSRDFVAKKTKKLKKRVEEESFDDFLNNIDVHIGLI